METQEAVDSFVATRIKLRKKSSKAWQKALQTAEAALIALCISKLKWEASLDDWFATGFLNEQEHAAAVVCLEGVAEDVPQAPFLCIELQEADIARQASYPKPPAFNAAARTNQASASSILSSRLEIAGAQSPCRSSEATAGPTSADVARLSTQLADGFKCLGVSIKCLGDSIKCLGDKLDAQMNVVTVARVSDCTTGVC